MPFNGAGIYSPPNPPVFPATIGEVIKSTYFNQIIQDLAAGLTQCITKDGQTTVTGVLSWVQPANNLAALGGVPLTGNATISGVKTFSSPPKSSVAAAAAEDLLRKGEADTSYAALAGLASQTFSVAAAVSAAHALRFDQVAVANAAAVKTALNAGGSAPIFACRAWVNFNGSGTVAIRGSGNVASVTDHGTGDYTVNFTTAMQDANYAAVVSGGDINMPGADFALYKSSTAAGYRFMVALTGSTTGYDSTNCSLAFFR